MSQFRAPRPVEVLPELVRRAAAEHHTMAAKIISRFIDDPIKALDSEYRQVSDLIVGRYPEALAVKVELPQTPDFADDLTGHSTIAHFIAGRDGPAAFVMFTMHPEVLYLESAVGQGNGPVKKTTLLSAVIAHPNIEDNILRKRRFLLKAPVWGLTDPHRNYNVPLAEDMIISHLYTIGEDVNTPLSKAITEFMGFAKKLADADMAYSGKIARQLEEMLENPPTPYLDYDRLEALARALRR